MKRFVLSFIVLVIAIGIPLLLIHSNERNASGNERITPAMLNKALTKTIDIAEKNYYKPIDRNEMYQGAIKGALASIGDPYTFLLSERDHRRSVENLYNAKFGGLGVQIYPDYRGYIKISKPIPGTPAEGAHLQAGDYITKVDGKQIYLGDTTGMTIEDVVDLLRGDVNTDVTLTVQRKYLDPFEVKLTRAKISVPSVNTTMLDGDIGYIQITKFIGKDRLGGTEEEFNKALASHQANGMQALILDLRGNQGGLLDAAYHIADAFISEGTIVSTKGRKKEFDSTYPAHKDILCDPNIPVVILVDEFSASASEIVAGAIKDTGRGILIGTKTYGKGVVQKRYPLSSIGAISVTISSYFTPNGTSIDKTGITPQVTIVDPTPNRIEQMMRRLVVEKNAIENFITLWIEEETKRTGELPQDFTNFEPELPKLRQNLSDDGLRVSMDWITQRAELLFNLNVGIDRTVNLKYDSQMKEAIRIINAGKVDTIISIYKNLDNVLIDFGKEMQTLVSNSVG